VTHLCIITTNLEKAPLIVLGPFEKDYDAEEAKAEWLRAFSSAPDIPGKKLTYEATICRDVQIPSPTAHRNGYDWIYSNYVQRWL